MLELIAGTKGNHYSNMHYAVLSRQLFPNQVIPGYLCSLEERDLVMSATLLWQIMKRHNLHYVGLTEI